MPGATRKEASDGGEIFPGVRELDHTADLGIRVRAMTLQELFQRAAKALLYLIYDDDAWDDSRSEAPAAGRERELVLEARGLPDLFVKWLQELLYLQEAEPILYEVVAFEELTDTRLRARLRSGPSNRQPIRELKGVTYHRLEVGREAGEWRAQVIFDV